MTYHPNPENSGIYLIVNEKERGVYVGRTAHNFTARWIHHRLNLRRGVHGNKDLQEAWTRGAEDDFKMVPAQANIPKEELAQAERAWIRKHIEEGWTVYNTYDRGENPRRKHARTRPFNLEPPENWGVNKPCPVSIGYQALTHECIIRCDRRGPHKQHGIMVHVGKKQEFWGWPN